MSFVKNIIRKVLFLLGYRIIKTSKENDKVTNEIQNTYGITKVHYACYRNYYKDWINVDRDITYEPGFHNVKANLTFVHPFPDETFDFGFCEDFIACINQSELIIFLYEVFRTFKMGGVLRISTPGLEGVLKKHYFDSKTNTAIQAKIDAFDEWNNYHFISHQTLELIIKHIGFSNIQKVEYGESEHLVLRGLDSRINQIGLNAYYEVTK